MTLGATLTETPLLIKSVGIPCESLKSLNLVDTTITAAETVGPGWVSPQVVGQVTVDIPMCRVAGTVSPSINFEVWMPLTNGDHPWNGRFNGVGNSGLAGSIAYASMLVALEKGYATASTDTGHQGSSTSDGTWMRDHPELLSDFSYRAVHMMTRDAKAIIQAYYGQAPQYSYFTGCSGGGEEALAEVQRYPADYNGLVAGAPANYRTHSWPGEFWPAYVTNRSAANALPEEKLTVIHQAALAACDATDGVTDGVISNPLACTFDPSVLLCQGADGPDCLTAGELDSLKLIYAGLKDPGTHEQFWPGLEPGSELGWYTTGSLLPKPFVLSLDYFKDLIFATNPAWDWRTFDITDPKDFASLTDAVARYGPALDINDPDLSAFRALGGKLILYHGWADQQITPQNSINYYKRVVLYMGGETATQEFMRLFMVPAMRHCGLDENATRFDALAAVEKWVEQRTVPDQMIASNVVNGVVQRTRPLCPFPQVAKYSGTGSTDDFKNFVCAAP